jgi:hypothetical protein
MNTIKLALGICFISLITLSCTSRSSERNGVATPIDSTNVNGTAPATYGGNNPANDETDTNKNNYGDTGTKANNIHNEGTYSNTSRDTLNAQREKNQAAAEKSLGH